MEDNYKELLRLFRSWLILIHPETDLSVDLLVDEFEEHYPCFKIMHPKYLELLREKVHSKSKE